MQAKSIYKVPDGKLLKINITYDKKNKSIDRIKIMGDFFAYPEESIDIIEKKLQKTTISKSCLTKRIDQIINENNIQFIGLDLESLVNGIMMCLK